VFAIFGIHLRSQIEQTMTSYVALLRAVNVGGRSLAMAALRDFAAGLDFTDPRTLLQSGNLVFGTSRPREPKELERLLEAKAEKRLALKIEFMVRTAQQLDAVIAENPFAEAAERDPGHLVVMFLKDNPLAEALEALCSASKGPETFANNENQLYIVYPEGIGRSKLTGSLIERKLGTRGTGRNWNTVLKLAALARS
jgi:uncharacterized protein (DUF1697 family)